MGIVFNQSYKNIIIIAFALLIGGVNTLYFYPVFLKEQYYGLVVFLLATSNLLQPLISFGSQHTIIKYFSSFNTKKEKDIFMSSIIFLPLINIIPITFLVVEFHDIIASFLSIENPIIESYVWVIFLVAFATSYFEVFYSWARVQLKSVFGNFLKEIFPRLAVLTLLTLVYLNQITKENFIWWLTGLYYLRLIIMIFYSFSLYLPKFTFSIPKNTKSILIYSLYILLAGSAASILIDIDKFMIPQKQAIGQTAFYAVAVFIATVVEIPGRAMFQIINPLVAKALNENNFNELRKLYSSSSINLLIVAGLIFLLINSSISPFYDLMIEKDYSNGIWVVLMISISKLILMSFGCGPAILATSKFYKITLPFSILMAFSVYFLNDILIEIYGINGAALSTLIVVLFFTVLKIIFIKYKLKISPYSINSLKVVSIIIVMFFAFQNFKITDNSILSIIIDSVLISIIYTTIIYFMNVSKPINKLIKNILYGKLRL
ncbi:MAG: polysaccharide biosynthesis C-terminal domain-containing protein [Bacteroidota bacterium]|nr:polysaccharide biosynthesis C-terminal domain-containing protein [Bacteroidota bacterium]